MGMDIFEQLTHKLLGWLGNQGLSILMVILVTLVVLRYMDGILDRLIRKMVPASSFKSKAEERKREDTLIKISQNFLRIILWIISSLGILYYLGVPIAPLITGAGIFGVAIGFGSQSLVKDVINGLFIILENQFRLGDVVSVGSFKGTVEGMTLRVTTLRAIDGTLHYIPNAEIKTASNYSKDYSKVDMIMDVAYDTDIDAAADIMNMVSAELAEEEAYREHIIEKPEFLRVQELADFSLRLRIVGKVLPGEQYAIEGELKKRFKEAFDRAGIEIPYPTQVIHSK